MQWQCYALECRLWGGADVSVFQKHLAERLSLFGKVKTTGGLIPEGVIAFWPQFSLWTLKIFVRQDETRTGEMIMRAEAYMSLSFQRCILALAMLLLTGGVAFLMLGLHFHCVRKAFQERFNDAFLYAAEHS